MELSAPVALAVLGAALLHAGWNALVKASADKQLDTLAIALAQEGVLAVALDTALTDELVAEGDIVVLVCGAPLDVGGRTNPPIVLPFVTAGG